MYQTIPNVNVPEGKLGNAEVQRFEVTSDDFFRCLMSYGHRAPKPGTYTRLLIDGEVIMSDTRAEKQDHLVPVMKARGNCLVTGLGLGMVANAMAQREEVKSVTVLELNPHVIELVKPSLHPKVQVIEADAFTWKIPPRQKWEVIWHDIWFSDSPKEREERKRLKAKFRYRWLVYHGVWGMGR